jgi:hypothetical protein
MLVYSLSWSRCDVEGFENNVASSQEKCYRFKRTMF